METSKLSRIHPALYQVKLRHNRPLTNLPILYFCVLRGNWGSLLLSEAANTSVTISPKHIQMSFTMKSREG
jgi:hypothetical protein